MTIYYTNTTGMHQNTYFSCTTGVFLQNWNPFKNWEGAYVRQRALVGTYEAAATTVAQNSA